MDDIRQTAIARFRAYLERRQFSAHTVANYTLDLPLFFAEVPVPLAQISCYVNLQEKKKTLPLSGTLHRLLDFSLCMDPSIRTPHQRSQASRLNHLLFEVMAVATPQVASSFVTKSLPALHTFDRAGGVAGTRRETKSQLSRCSYLSENASIREERFRNLFYPFLAWDS